MSDEAARSPFPKTPTVTEKKHKLGYCRGKDSHLDTFGALGAKFGILTPFRGGKSNMVTLKAAGASILPSKLSHTVQSLNKIHFCHQA